MWPQIAILIRVVGPLPDEWQRLASGSDLNHPIKVGFRLDANVRSECDIGANVHDAIHARRPWIRFGRSGLFEESRIVANAEMRSVCGLLIILVAHSSEAQTTTKIFAE